MLKYKAHKTNLLVETQTEDSSRNSRRWPTQNRDIRSRKIVPSELIRCRMTFMYKSSWQHVLIRNWAWRKEEEVTVYGAQSV